MRKSKRGRMRILPCAALVFLVLLNTAPPHARGSEESFPLSPGTYWVYEGNVKWTDASGAVRERPVTWKMEVVRRSKNGPYDIAVLKGHPFDLCWYEPGKQRGDYLIVRKDNEFHLAAVNDDLERLIGDESYLSKKIGPGSLFLVTPLARGAEFGMEPGDRRTDHMYRWVVTDEKSADLSRVAGASKRHGLPAYTLAYRTNPDHQVVEFIPSIGITGFVYAHHGTVSEANVRLVEFNEDMAGESPATELFRTPAVSTSER